MWHADFCQDHICCLTLVDKFYSLIYHIYSWLFFSCLFQSKFCTILTSLIFSICFFLFFLSLMIFLRVFSLFDHILNNYLIDIYEQLRWVLGLRRAPHSLHRRSQSYIYFILFCLVFLTPFCAMKSSLHSSKNSKSSPNYGLDKFDTQKAIALDMSFFHLSKYCALPNPDTWGHMYI